MSTGFMVAVYGPDGTVLNGTTVNNLPRLGLFQVGGRTDVTAPTAGTLTAVVWEATGTKGGVYYISGTRLNGGCGGSALTCSSTLDGQITTPASYVSYRIAATRGDTYQLRMGRTDTSGAFTVSADVYDPQGAWVKTVGPVSPSGHAAASGIVKFPSTGVYSVLVSGPADGSSGTFSITSTRVNRPCAESGFRNALIPCVTRLPRERARDLRLHSHLQRGSVDRGDD